MILNETYTLSNGVKIPKLGLGTWEIVNDRAAQAVREAIQIGYRHIDTAEGYMNEQGVGEGIRTCGLPREELFVTTKLDASMKTYGDAKAGIEGSLRTMGLDYLDLMIIHSPQPWNKFRGKDHYFEGNLEAWRALEEAYKAGRIRAIGVSNFEEIDLDNILDHGNIKPMVNQILVHISNTPTKLIEYTKNKGLLVEAYSPIAHGELLNNREIGAMAANYQVTLPQLCIQYCLQLGLVALPKTSNPKHMQSNAQLNFQITDTDMKKLKKIAHIKDYGHASIYPVYGGKTE